MTQAEISARRATATGRRGTYHVPVSAKDERVFQERRAACRNALTDGGVSLDQADHWCDAWQLEAALHGIGRSAEYWQDGKRWIDVQRAAGKKPQPS